MIHKMIALTLVSVTLTLATGCHSLGGPGHLGANHSGNQGAALESHTGERPERATPTFERVESRAHHPRVEVPERAAPPRLREVMQCWRCQ